jgi:maltoporin
MPFLPLSFHAHQPSSSRPRRRSLLLGLVAGTACLGVGTLSAQSDPEIEELKKKLAEMDAKLKSMEAQVALTAAVAKSRTITGPDGKEVDLKAGPMVIPDLASFTRNFKFHLYMRAGVGFASEGVGQTFNFTTPDFSFGKTSRLGNENDFYFETGPIWDHMLGDDPDVIDVKAKMTFGMTNGVDKQTSENLENDNFNVFLRELYVEMKNVIKSAPEVTFWAGQRFYDRYDIHPSDFFFLDTSGWGGGAYNIPLGPGLLQIAYLGGIRSGTGTFFLDDTSFNDVDLETNAGSGEFYRHVFDVRWGDVDFLWGKLKLVAIGSYQHGGDFTINAQQDRTDGVTDPNTDGQGNVNNSGGVGGGFVQQWDLPQLGKLSYVQFSLLYGWGLVDFDTTGVNLDKLVNAYNSAVAQNNSPAGTFKNINPYNKSQRGRANVFWVWNPTDNFSMGTWASYQFDDQGFTSYQVDTDGSISSASRYSHLVSAGIRPYYWLWGPFAIQGAAAFAYLNNNRTTGAAFGEGGALGIFTIAPTIKPRGGFFTRPEIRAFATFACWSKDLQGSIGNPAFTRQNYGFVFGVQAETWF